MSTSGEETIAVLSDNEAVRQLAVSEEELEDGYGESEATLADAMAARREVK